MSIQRYILGNDRSLPSKNGFYVTYKDHQAEIAELTKRLEAAELNAARYEWLRNPDQEVGLVIDKTSSPGIYEYKAGVELDYAIDAARLAQGKAID